MAQKLELQHSGKMGKLIWTGIGNIMKICASMWTLIIYSVRHGTIICNKTIDAINHKDRFIIAFTMIFTILLWILPMSFCPIWNGEIPSHRNQYEVLAESILDGRINLDYGDMDPRLLELENPYDPNLREGIPCHWDHAFYNGSYYMYFGVVPVFLLFLPFRIITGTSLTTYHATQIFTIFFIWGVFALFFLFSRKFFRKMTLSVYLSLSVAASSMSVWFISAQPALYCTAVSSGICMEIWSLFFFAKAAYDSNDRLHSKYIYGMLGSLFGALAFGCRPPVALANILAIPMLMYYAKKRHFNLEFLKQILIVFIPYIVIGMLLMAYNYARFENPFEFGQRYQLTVADQRNIIAQLNLKIVIKKVLMNFIAHRPFGDSFPYVQFQSLLFNFPIYFITILCLFLKPTFSALKKNKLIGLMGGLILCPILINIIQVLTATVYYERYRSDIYWLMGIFIFLSFGHFLEGVSEKSKRIYGLAISLLSIMTSIYSFLLYYAIECPK